MPPCKSSPERTMSHLSLSLLGTFEVTLNGERVTAFGADKSRALLAFLAIESAHPHRRAELAGMFWPDFTEKKAAHNLSQTLLRLRRALREPEVPANATSPLFLLITPQDVQFNPDSDHQLDVALFTALFRASRQHQHPDAQTCTVCMQWLHQAADLYRGDLLAGFFLRDSVGFEEWQLVQQEALHRQAVEILARLATYHEARGEPQWVQHYAGRLTALDPWHERGHLQLMRALAYAGQTTAALEKYALYCRILAEEFGLPPSAEATALFKQIQAGQVGQDAAEAPAARAATGAGLSAGQDDRRQVTALICGRRDLASSTDPEGHVEHLARCSERCAAVLERYAGQRQPRQGTQCLIYFGYPVAHEDAARRAVYAGLALVEATIAIGHRHAVGIHTGVMASVAGELVGDVPDMARGCQALAAPGTVLITADTERLVQGWFHCQELAPSTLPGVAGPVGVYQVLEESAGQNRLDGLARRRGLTPLVGRQPELERLLTYSDQMLRGAGQTILISGEPGIGKSRLLWELRARFSQMRRDENVIWLESGCSPYFQNTSLYPIIGLLAQLLGFAAGDTPEVKRDKLNGTLARCDLAHPAASWLLSLLLGLPTESPTPQAITPDQRERMREMVVLLLQRQAALQPLVVVIEDLHWSDPTTIEWLGRSFDALATVPCLLLLTGRPTFNAPWLPRASLLRLPLEPFNPAQAESLVTHVAGDRALPDAVRRRIVGQTDGVPLFVEELTKAVLDLPPTEIAKTPGVGQIPTTLRDSLMAHLDHAGAAKETAQWASVLGREFSYAVLRAIVPYDEQRLQNDLAALIETHLLTAQDQPAQAGFAFKHTLMQEAAYASLLRQTRQECHRRIAETLENGFPQVAESQPELLAQHYFNAGRQTQAVDFWLRAGERATAQGATLEATTFFDRALEQIAPEDYERRWRALWGRETALYFRGERAAQPADIAALLTVAESLGDDARRAQAHIRQARYATSQADYRGQLAAAEAAIAAADRAGALTVTVEALAYQVTALMRLGERMALPPAVARTLAQAQQIHDDNVRAYAHAAVALYYVEAGDLARAAQLLGQCLAAARRAKARDLNLESQYYGHLGFTYAQLGLYPQARETLEAGLELARSMGIGRYQAYYLLNLGFVYWRLGDLNTAVQAEAQALADYMATGEVFGQAVSRAYLGCIAETAGDLAGAAEYLTAACTGFDQVGVAPDKFEAQAVAARVALAQGRRDEARQWTREVWDYLCDQGPEGLGSPAWTYVCVADVAEALPTSGIAPQEVIATGYHDLMQRADKIGDREWRQAFLENVAENREIAARWQALNKDSASGD